MIRSMAENPDCDDTHWPLAIMVSETSLCANDLQPFLDTMERWLSRRKPFALMLVAAARPVFRSHGSGLHRRHTWFEANRGRMRELVLGIAIVAPHSKCLIPLLRPCNIRLDIPAKVFDTGREAAIWLDRSVLMPAGHAAVDL